jgi:nudix-type nucleoside diphosphatase (YffH/AdpP family)
MAMDLVDNTIVHRGWATLSVARFRLSTGQTIRREIEDHGNAAAVLAYDETRRVAMVVRQLRAPVFLAAGAPDLAEAVAGIADEADPAATARREAFEEAGLVLGPLEPVGRMWSMPGLSTERMALFLARYVAADRTGAGGGAAGEQERVEAVEVPLAELARRADAGELADMKTFALVQTLRLRHPELFA